MGELATRDVRHSLRTLHHDHANFSGELNTKTEKDTTLLTHMIQRSCPVYPEFILAFRDSLIQFKSS